jgi:hypothetical protein
VKKRDTSYLIGNQHAKGAKPNKTAFKKGNIPWNKNKKGIHLSPKTEFKKGCESLNKLPVGTITTRTRNRGGIKKRQYIKIEEPNVWVPYATYVWESHFGKIKKGDVIHHLNGDSLDDRIENLIAFPRADHPVFHSRWGLKQLTQEQLNYYFERYTKPE